MTDPRVPTTLDEELISAQEAEVLSTRSDDERLLAIDRELRTGFDTLAHVGAAVSIFGSARTPEDDPEYEQARRLGQMAGESGIAVITGGGPGIMEAANRGAYVTDSPSIGLGIELPFEQGMNSHLDIGLNFHYFFARKVMFVRYASGFVVFPGGFGTLDELFEALTLIQTDKIHNFPVVLVGTGYWGGLVGWLRERMLAEAKISPEDMDLFTVTDDLDEVLRRLLSATHRQPRRA